MPQERGYQLFFHALNRSSSEKVSAFPPCAPASPLDPSHWPVEEIWINGVGTEAAFKIRSL